MRRRPAARERRAARSRACARPSGCRGRASTSSSSARVSRVGDAADRLAVHALDERLAGQLPVRDVRAQRRRTSAAPRSAASGGAPSSRQANSSVAARVGVAACSSGGPSRPRGTARGARAGVSSAARTCAIARVVEAGLAVLRRVAGGEQHLVALAQRDVERAGELAAPSRGSGSRGRSRRSETWRGVTPASVGERELAHPALRAPVLQQAADGAGSTVARTLRRGACDSLPSEGIEPRPSRRRGCRPCSPSTPRIRSRRLPRDPRRARAQHRLHPQPGRDDRRLADRDAGLRRRCRPRCAARTLTRARARGRRRHRQPLQRLRVLARRALEVRAHAGRRRRSWSRRCAAGEPLADERLEALRAFTLALLDERGHADGRRARRRGGARGDRPGRLHDARQLRRRRVGRVDRRRLRLEGQPTGASFRTRGQRRLARLRGKAAGRRVRPQLGAISDEARHRDRPSREDERGAGSPLPRRGARVLDEPRAGSRRRARPRRDLPRHDRADRPGREGPLRDRGLRRVRASRRSRRSATAARPARSATARSSCSTSSRSCGSARGETDNAAVTPVGADDAAGIDTGDTAWMLIATALVLLMTPALGLFYAGLVRAKNTLNTFMMCVAALAVATITWALSATRSRSRRATRSSAASTTRS